MVNCHSVANYKRRFSPLGSAGGDFICVMQSPGTNCFLNPSDFKIECIAHRKSMENLWLRSEVKTKDSCDSQCVSQFSKNCCPIASWVWMMSCIYLSSLLELLFMYQSVQSTETSKFKTEVILKKKSSSFLLPLENKYVRLFSCCFVSYPIFYISKSTDNYIILCLLKLCSYPVIHVRHLILP